MPRCARTLRDHGPPAAASRLIDQVIAPRMPGHGVLVPAGLAGGGYLAVRRRGALAVARAVVDGGPAGGRSE